MDKSKIKYLSWDSDFFRRKIGQIDYDNSQRLKDLLYCAKNEDYKLIYVFGNEDLFIEEKILQQFNGHLADRKILYSRRCISSPQSLNVSEYNSEELTKKLEALAYESGKYSRFRLDENFTEIDFYRMYKVWMENSIKRQIADYLFVAKTNLCINGMVTLKIDGNIGRIGLIAVAPDVQGTGLGKALIQFCENKLFSKNIMTLEVPTQFNNRQACHFYEKCGFRIKNITNIYHFWL